MRIPVAGEVTWMAFSSSGTRLAIHDKIGVTVCDYTQGNIIFKLDAPSALDCAYSPDGRLLACKDYEQPEGFFGKTHLQYVHIWDITRHEQVCRVEFPHDHESVALCCLKFSPDSAQLAMVREDGLVCVIRIATGQAIHLETPRKRFYSSRPSCVFFPGSDALAYTYLDEAINITDLNAGRRVLSLALDTESGVFECNHIIGFRRSDQKLLVAVNGKDDYHNRIDALDARNGTRIPFILGSRGYLWCPSHIALSPDGSYLAASVLKEVRRFVITQALYAVTVWNAVTGDVITETTTDKATSEGLVSSVFSLAFDPTGGLFVGRRDSIQQVAMH